MRHSISRRWLVTPLLVCAVSLTCTDEQPTLPLMPDQDALPTPDGLRLSMSGTSSGSPVLVGAGDIANCSRPYNSEATAALLDGIPGTVFTAGDNAYSDGSAADFANCYEPSWGRHKSRTRPAPGDRDYKSSGGAAYHAYFGTAAGTSGEGYYSYDLGEWHVVVVNTKLSLSAGSSQLAWLLNDLTVNPAACAAVISHTPRYSSVSGGSGDLTALWDVLYERGVELLISAGEPVYERFAPQDAASRADEAHGVRQIVIGTGGATHRPFETILPNSEARSTAVYGVLKLTLHASGYDWEFVPVAGKTYTDAGSSTCHGTPGGDPPPDDPPVAHAGGPYTSSDGSGTIEFDGSASSDPQGDLPLSHAWSFGDGESGSGATPSHTYSANGTYTVSLRVTDSKGNQSASTSTTATVSGITSEPETGDLTVTATTTGDDPDSDGYQVTLLNEAGTTVVAGPKALGSNGSATFDDVAAGTYTVKLDGIALNCSTGLTGNARKVSVTAGETASTSFTVTCSAEVTTGSIEATVSTSGSNLDPDGYTFTLDPGAPQARTSSVGINGSVTFADVIAGTHDVQLSGLATNCTAAANTKSVAVAAGATATVSFSVTCTAPPVGGSEWVLIGAGDIASCQAKAMAFAEATAAIIDAHPDAIVFTAGDNAYPDGTLQEYQDCYEPTWGRHKWRTRAALGNRDYNTGNANGSFDYFGSQVGPRNLGYFSFDVGNWHVVVINDNIDFSAGSAQDQWLLDDLASTSNKKCTIAIWHQPYVFSSGSKPGRSGPRKILWERMYDAGVELVINGHRQWYERFAPMNVDLERDDTHGVREIIVGTGGEEITPARNQNGYNSEVIGPRDGAGVIKLTLRSNETYSWEFIPVPGVSFTDSGTGACHQAAS